MLRRSSRKNSRRAFLAALFVLAALALAVSPRAQALDQYPGDTSIYGVSTATIQPNVLIVLDNSGSMGDNVVTGAAYDPATVYPSTDGCQGQPCVANKVYRWRAREGKWINFISNVNSINCASAKNSLLSTGTYQGRLRTNGNCSGSSSSFALGNYVNWLNAGGGTRAKMDVAKEVLTNLINTTTGVRFGLMLFNTSNGGHIAGVGDSYGWSNYDAYVTDMDTVFTGSSTNRDALVSTINNVDPSTWTPLAETLYESMRYYSGASTAFNGSYTYTTPIQYSCQKNYVIIITDGMSTEDRSPVLRTICNNGDCDADGYEPSGDPSKAYDSQGSDYLDDVAKYMYDTDLLPDSGTDTRTTGKQNVITYTIGFGLAGDTSGEMLLQEAAYNGGGNYYSASSTAGLSESLRRILASVIEVNTSFVAPVLPVSPENRTFSGNRLYMGFFKPSLSAFWSGNIKKYGLDSSGAIVDKNGNPATNSDGSIRDNAVSFWSTAADGGNVESGGAGNVLLTRATPRDIYTFTGTSLYLSGISNAFTTSNTAITPSMLAVADTAEKDRLINFVRGLDAYDSDGNGETDEYRDWVLGDILHSRPVVINYSRFSSSDEADCMLNRSLIFVGSNDGMLHAFADCDGSEKWAFIPQDLLPALKELPAATHTYFVDSSVSTYIFDANDNGDIEPMDGDRVVIIFGERRGGGYYYALDVTDPDSPEYLWRISASESPSGTSTDYSELAETWSEPAIAKVKVDVGGLIKTKIAAFVGAGYDEAAEDVEPAVASTKGRGVYAIEIATLESGYPDFTNSGHKVWGYTYAENSSLTKSIPSQLSVVDVGGNGFVDRIYTGDTGANLWRFDIYDTDTSSWTARKIFQSSPGADLSTGRKMFYRPSVTLEHGYELLFSGTGDRAHPVTTSVVDRLYAIKDTGQLSAYTESDLVDVTTASYVSGSLGGGWYIMLEDNPGEKVLASPAVISKVAYFTTYAPPASTTGVCSADNRGTATFYALGYLNAAPVYNYDLTNDSGGVPVYGASDRSVVIGTGIPSGMVTVISPGGISAVVGVGGSLVTPPVTGSGAVIPTYWREVY